MFSFGQIRIRITGNSYSGYLCNPIWQKYLTEDQESLSDAELTVETGTLSQYEPVSDRWSCIKEDEEQQVTFSEKGHALFTLQYRPGGRKVKIITADTTGRSNRLGIQFGFLLAMHRNYVGVHGVTLLCGNEIIILSAPSGTGKTTLAKLLETYCDAIVINGDFALLGPAEDGVIFEPTPFCGSSGRSLNHRFRVNRIVFLGQAGKNAWYELSAREALTRFMSNSFIPVWDSHMQQTVQENILKCISMLKVNAYDFEPTQEAAETFLRKLKE